MNNISKTDLRVFFFYNNLVKNSEFLYSIPKIPNCLLNCSEFACGDSELMQILFRPLHRFCPL